MSHPALQSALWHVCSIAVLVGGCKLDPPGLREEQRPAKGSTIRYSKSKKIRCPVRLEPYRNEEGERVITSCVSEAELREICSVANCKETKRPRGGKKK